MEKEQTWKEKYKNKAIDRVKIYLSHLEYEREIDKIEQFIIASVDRFDLTTDNIEDKSKKDYMFEIIDNLDATLIHIKHHREILKKHKIDNTFIPMTKALFNKL